MKNLSKRITAAVLALLMAAGAGTSSLPFLSGTDTSITASAEAATSSESYFSAQKYTEIMDGLIRGKKYTVGTTMVKAIDPSATSMSDAAVGGSVVVGYKDGQIYVDVTFKPLNLLGDNSFLSNLWYYESGNIGGDYKAVEVLSTYDDIDVYNGKTKDSQGNYTSARFLYPKTMRFPIMQGIKRDSAQQLIGLRVFVPVMDAIQSGSGTQDVYMKLDWNTAKEVASQPVPWYYDPVNVDNGVIVLPFIPAPGSSIVKLEASESPNNPAEGETVTQLEDGLYTVHADMVSTPEADARVPKRGEAIKDDFTVSVKSGKIYLRNKLYPWTNNSGTHYYTGFYINKNYQWFSSSGDIKAMNGGFVLNDLHGFYDVTDECNKTVEQPNGDGYTTTVNDVLYPNSIGFELLDGKLNNGYQFVPMKYVELVKKSSTNKSWYQNCESGSVWYWRIDWTTLQKKDDWSYTKADYTAVDEAIAKVPKDMSDYTDESIKAVKDAVNAVVRDYEVSMQDDVDAMAKAINDAIAALEYQPADYTSVDKALAKAEALTYQLYKYTDESVKRLDDAVEAVVRGYNITQQDDVDAMAKAIKDAIAALEEKPADGKYTVSVDMIKLNKTDKSMSDGAINHTVQIDVVNGEYYATMQFRGLAISNNYGFLKDLSYYDKGYKFENGKLTGTVLPAEVLKTQKYDDGSDYIDQYNDKDNLYPQTVKFKLVDKADSEYVPLQVFVPIMEAISTGNGTQNVLMKIDWSTLQKTDKDVEQDPPIKQPPVFDAADEATGVSAHADKGVLPEGAKLVVTPVTSGSDMDNAKKALDGTARDFDLYDISFTDASGEPVTPNGIVNVTLPVNKAFTDQLGVYRIKDDGSKVAMSGEAKDGSYTFAFKSEQNIKAALADKAEKTAENAIVRYAGKNRYATAAEISKNSFKSADNVVLAYGLDSADALAGVSLAAKLKAPLLLTSKDKLPSETVDEIKRLGAKNVTILGGTGAISDDVKAAIEKIGVKTERIAGSTRFGTATAIAEKLSSEPEEIFFVYAFNYPDALSASAVAAIKNAPVIYLKTGGDIDADTAKYLERVKGKVKNAYVIGGDKVITDDMMKKAGDALGLETGKTITRISGKNRFETCIAVNNAFKDVLTGKAISVATGVDFPDALAGGVFAAMNKTPLFLTGKTLDEQQLNYLNSRKASSIFVFGGTGAVSDDAAKQIAKTTL